MFKKSEKSLIRVSITILAISLLLLVNFTYAWFSSQVESKGNIIKTGNLEVALEYSDGSLDVNENQLWVDVEKSEEPIFNLDYVEPGYRAVRHLKISNKGNLAINYKLKISSDSSLSYLSESFDVYLLKDVAKPLTSFNLETMEKNKIGSLKNIIDNGLILDQGVILPLNGSDSLGNTMIIPAPYNESAYVTVVLRMREDVDSSLMNTDLNGSFDIKLEASQESYEKDGIDDTYDKDLGL